MSRLKWIVGMAVFIAMLSPVAILAKERRIALVIGNGAYKDSPLRNPVNDATDISDVLKELDFQVITRTDATLRQMEGALDEFWGELKSGGVGLFYFAGHGLQVQGRNYLVPVDAKVAVEQDVKFECLDAGKVLGRMEAAANELNLVFLDACRNNPFARSFRSGSRGLARMDAPTGSLVAFATAPGSVAADGEGRNGVFTRALIEHIKEPGVPINKLLMNVRRKVATITDGRQVPWESSSLMDDFYFSPNQNIRENVSFPDQNHEKEGKYIVHQGDALSEFKVIGKDQRLGLTKYDNGIVYDENTGFEWYVDLLEGRSYDESVAWIEGLNVGGGRWRMPSVMELQTLHIKHRDRRRKHLSPLLGGRDWAVWVPRRPNEDVSLFFRFVSGREGRIYNGHGTKMKAIAIRTKK